MFKISAFILTLCDELEPHGKFGKFKLLTRSFSRYDPNNLNKNAINKSVEIKCEIRLML